MNSQDKNKNIIFNYKYIDINEPSEFKNIGQIVGLLLLYSI